MSVLALALLVGCPTARSPGLGGLDRPSSEHERPPAPTGGLLLWEQSSDGSLQTRWRLPSGEVGPTAPGLLLSSGSALWALTQQEAPSQQMDAACARAQPTTTPAWSLVSVEPPGQEIPLFVDVRAAREATRTPGQPWLSWLASIAVVGTAGPYLFLRADTYQMACGDAHGLSQSFSSVIDLRTGQPARVLSDAERAALPAAIEGPLRAAYEEERSLDPTGPLPEGTLTLLLPALPHDHLTLHYQLTLPDCYACSDGEWSDYTTSVRVPAPTLPAALAPFANAPAGTSDALAAWAATLQPPARAMGYTPLTHAQTEAVTRWMAHGQPLPKISPTLE